MRAAAQNAVLLLVCTAAMMAATQIERPLLRALVVVMGACLQSLLVLKVEAAIRCKRRIDRLAGVAGAVPSPDAPPPRPPLARRAVTGDAKVSRIGTCRCGASVWLARDPTSLIHEDPSCELYRSMDGRAYLDWLYKRGSELAGARRGDAALGLKARNGAESRPRTT